MLLLGIALGAGVAYFLDPNRGSVRRRRVVQEARHLIEDVAALLGSKTLAPEALPAALEGAPRRRDDLPGLGGVELRAQPYDQGPPGALLGLAGGLLTAFGLTRRDRIATAMAALGAGMVAGGVVQNPALGLRDRRRAIEVQRTLQLDAPADEVFAWWSRPERLARFMSYVEEVRDLGGGRVEWRVDGPRGEPLVWGATITAVEPGRLLAWRSDADAAVSQSATVRATPTAQGTQLDVRIAYAPPAGHDEPDVTALLGWDPRYTIDQDLERLARLLAERSATDQTEE
ncbi:MAG: SRPBCC family protein [Gemmatimonadota bacterium]|nr:SRPBCC family protein [Gemmatimonadota bacterium]